MSYDIELVDPVTKATLKLDAPHHMRGGTYALGGTTEARLNVTYNYAPYFHKVFGDADVELSAYAKMFGGGETGIRKLYGMTGAESIPVLETAISQLGDDVDDDYWAATEGKTQSGCWPSCWRWQRCGLTGCGQETDPPNAPRSRFAASPLLGTTGKDELCT